MWLMAEINSLWVVGVRVFLAGYWQEATLDFLTHEPLLHDSLFHQSEKTKNARENLLTSESIPAGWKSESSVT